MKNITTVHTIEVTIHHKKNERGAYDPEIVSRNDLQRVYKELLGADHVYLVKTQTFETDDE